MRIDLYTKTILTIIAGSAKLPAFPSGLAYWEKSKWRVAKCKEAKRKAAYPSSVPIPEPTTTSLRKCIPDTTREIATFAARTISTGIISA
jgi:hypothetical protein